MSRIKKSVTNLVDDKLDKVKRTYAMARNIKHDIQSFDEETKDEIQGYLIGWFFFLVPAFNMFVPIIYLSLLMVAVALYYMLSVMPVIEEELEQ